MNAWVLMAAMAGTVAPAKGLVWEFTDTDEVVSSANLECLTFQDGLVFGRTAWDPYVYLRLPEEGLDVRGLPFITARLYSDREADNVSVYYRASDGTWGLGSIGPVMAGWATYRADLREADWHETSGGAEAAQWGGAGKILSTFRVDPGNQQDRWVVLDRVALLAEPDGPLGIHPEPPLPVRIEHGEIRVQASPVEAGQEIVVELDLTLTGDADVGVEPVLALLTEAGKVAQARLVTPAMTGPRTVITVPFATSRYAPGVVYTASAEILGRGRLGEPVRVELRNSRRSTLRLPGTRMEAIAGTPVLHIDGRPEPLITYCTYGHARIDLHREMADAGITLFTDWFGGSTAGDLGRMPDGSFSYATYDRYFTTILDAIPEARFLPHIGVVAPRWWQEKYPDECCLYSDGDRGPSSLFSERWQQDCGADLERLIAHLRAAPYADRILGYIVYAGHTAEWQMWATWHRYGESDDYSEPAQRWFRRWLRREYGTDEALRQAWADPEVTLDTAVIPAHAEREAPGPFVLHEPARRRLVDVEQCFSDGVANAIAHFAAVAKRATDHEQVVGTYYGYLAAHGMRQGRSGHNALGTLLTCPDLDFLMSPPMYTNRQAGGSSTFMSATESVHLHGKLWLDESDLRSYLSEPGSGFGRTDTAMASVGATWREFGHVAARRAGVSWYDMGGGWFSSAQMLDTYREQVALARELLETRRPHHGDLALFIDDLSNPWFARSDLLRHMVGVVVAEMPHTGLTWDLYLLSDVMRDDLPAYRLYAVLNAVRFPMDWHRALEARAARDRAALLYVYAPGYAGPEVGGVDGTVLRTGVELREVASGSAAYEIEPGVLPGRDGPVVHGPDQVLEPRLVVVPDPSARVLGRFADGAGPAVVVTEADGVKRFVCTSVGLPVDLWREIGREVGAHVFIESGDAVSCDGQLLTVHGATGGTKQVTLPEGLTATHLRGGRMTGGTGARIEFELEKGDTAVWRLAP